MHPLLARQLRRHLGALPEPLPPELAALPAFLEAIDAAYLAADEDRARLEHTLDVTSQELNARHHELQAELVQRQQMADALQRGNQELQEINRKLETAQDQLLQADKMASIGQLAAGVAHEINNPIGYVYSNLGTLENYLHGLLRLVDQYAALETQLPDADRTALDAVRQDIDFDFLRDDLASLMAESKEGITRVKKIVQDLKDFSHADEAEWQLADLHRGLDSTLNIVHNELKDKAEVRREYGNLPAVECIASQLNQVFMNLLVNASHAISRQGTITVRTGQVGEEVFVAVSDTGGGIPPEIRTRVFDAFFTTKPVGKGTGLGLSLSYSIIRKHHGRIELDSEVGRGTTFTIWLPVTQPEGTAET